MQIPTSKSVLALCCFTSQCFYSTAESSERWEALRRNPCDTAFLLCPSLNSRIRKSQFIHVQLPASFRLISADEKFWPVNFYTQTFRFSWDKCVWACGSKEQKRHCMRALVCVSLGESSWALIIASHFSSDAFLQLHPSVSCVIWNAS